MFRFSKIKRPDTCPVHEEIRIWLEGAFLQLLDFFGNEKTIQRKVLIPHFSDFPIQYNGSEQSAISTLEVIATQMEIPIDSIHLEFYNGEVNEIGVGSLPGQGIYLQSRRGNSAGMYWGKDEQGKFIVSLVRNQLSLPENMVATLAHELAHIKLLGEQRMSYNDERLTDLVTVLFGLGIFSANTAFQTYTSIGHRGWRSMGYLNQMEWGYALALFAHLRGEQKPSWMDHLNLTVKGDFVQGQNYIRKNSEKIFQQPLL